MGGDPLQLLNQPLPIPNARRRNGAPTAEDRRPVPRAEARQEHPCRPPTLWGRDHYKRRVLLRSAPPNVNCFCDFVLICTKKFEMFGRERFAFPDCTGSPSAARFLRLRACLHKEGLGEGVDVGVSLTVPPPIPRTPALARVPCTTNCFRENS